MKIIFSLCFLFVFGLAAVRAGEPAQPTETVLREQSETDGPFTRGTWEFQDVTGEFLFFTTTKNNRPSIDLLVNSARLGIMLYDPQGPGLLRGNFEFLGEIFGGPITTGPGNLTAGSTLIFRYNFIQPHTRIIPYLQIGAGGVYTDIPEDESRGLISLPVEFNLQGIGGLRYMLNDRWSLVIEAGYRHISNAEIEKPNFGLDNVGGNVGFGFSF